MAKKQRNPRNYQMYSRPTKAYQQNMAKNMPEMQMPKMPQRKQMLILNIAVLVVVVALIVLLSRISWPLAYIPLALGIAYFILFVRYMNRKQKSLIEYYQKMGMSKKAFCRQMELQGMKQKNMQTYIRIWDIVAGNGTVKLKWMEKLLGY